MYLCNKCRAIILVMMATRDLTYRRMDLPVDGELAFSNYRRACIASFGSADSCSSQASYLAWLSRRIEEFPDGQIIASLGDRFVGQLELQVPYGSPTGYINLFYVAPAWRRLGFGRRLHEFAERYFRSWEATCVELHVSPNNIAAVRFYRSLGYRTIELDEARQRVWKMRREITAGTPTSG
jgi:GNAT superfamily N-acetyltransferase